MELVNNWNKPKLIFVVLAMILLAASSGLFIVLVRRISVNCRKLLSTKLDSGCEQIIILCYAKQITQGIVSYQGNNKKY